MSWRRVLREWANQQGRRLAFCLWGGRMLASFMDRETKLVYPRRARRDWLATYPAILGILMEHWARE